MTYLGELNTSELTSSIDSTASGLASIYSAISQYQAILDSSTSAYEKAVARNELAKLNVERARLEAIEAFKKYKWYALGGVGIVALLGIVAFTSRKKK